jgi:hypothetical protein
MAVTVKFVNCSSVKDEEIWIQFVSGSVAGTGNSGAIVLAESVFGHPNAYSLKQLNKQMNLTGMTGRMYLNFGPEPWKIHYQGYEPPSNNQTDENFPIRFDKIEANITGGPYDNMDTTSMDYFSIPIKATSYLGTKEVYQLKASSGTVVKNALGALTDYNPNIVIDRSKFVRVIGPGLAPSGAYDDFSEYLSYMKSWKGTTTIAGTFGGSGGGTSPEYQKQSYKLTADFSRGSEVVLSGSGTVVGALKISLPLAGLMAPTGIYGANPPYSVNGAPEITGGNQMYTWITADLLAGMAVGAVGSEAKLPTRVGELPSSAWWSLKRSDLYAVLQKNAKHYNQYSAALNPISDAYGFAYTDRFKYTTMSLAPSVADTLVLEILAD